VRAEAQGILQICPFEFKEEYVRLAEEWIAKENGLPNLCAGADGALDWEKMVRFNSGRE
jgi:hypothetical protein